MDEYWIGPSTVRTTHRMTEAEAEEILETSPGEHPGLSLLLEAGSSSTTRSVYSFVSSNQVWCIRSCRPITFDVFVRRKRRVSEVHTHAALHGRSDIGW